MAEEDDKAKLKEVYRKYDANGNGKLSFEEFFKMLKTLNSDWEEESAQTLFQSCDQDLSGDLDFDEFVDYISGDEEFAASLFKLEDKASEEEAKEALLTKSHQIRANASKNAAKKGLIWRDLSWKERLDEVTELEKGSKEETDGRAEKAPCKAAASRDTVKKAATVQVMETKPKETEEKTEKRASVPPQRLKTEKFGIAAMNQEAIVNYSLTREDMAFTAGAKEAADFKEYLKTAGGPLDDLDIIKFIAKGTAGFVFLAEDKSSKTKVAMKLIRMTQAKTGVREWYISKQLVEAGIDKVVLTSENVYVLDREHAPESVVDVIKDAGPVPFYMAMIQPLMPWGTLEDLASKGELSPAIMFKALDDVASTLAEMHAVQVQHRDVKPENIMLEMKDDLVVAAKLCDLGSSELGDDKKGVQDDIRRFGVTMFSVATGEGWTKNRLIRAKHEDLVERLTADVKDAEDENMKMLPDVLKEILDGGLSMKDVSEIMREMKEKY